MEGIDGFADLSPEQKLFLVKYIELYPAKLASAQAAGISPNKMKSWFTIPEFREIADIIREFYAESLAATHLDDAVHNPKVRGQVLKAIKAEGYEPTTSNKVGTQNNLVVANNAGLAGVLKLLKNDSDS